jgi:hypothetical protein
VDPVKRVQKNTEERREYKRHLTLSQFIKLVKINSVCSFMTYLSGNC